MIKIFPTKKRTLWFEFLFKTKLWLIYVLNPPAKEKKPKATISPKEDASSLKVLLPQKLMELIVLEEPERLFL